MKLNPMHYIRLWREPWRRQFWSSFYAWRRENGETRRLALDWLQPTDTVFDFGGYEGEWAAHVVRARGCTVHVFEPHPRFARALEARFADDPRVVVHPFALGAEDGTLHLSDAGDASSAVTGGGVKAELRAARRFLAGIEPPVALAKINIEGGEYELLPALADAGWLDRIRVLQIQFHLYAQDDIRRRNEMRELLSRTHDCDWEYPFVWEQWTARG